MLSKTFKTFDIVLVPFPFVDSGTSKNRPALILSSKLFGFHIEHHVLAMITSTLHTQWPLDSKIKYLKSAGLSKPSIIRMKLFTLDERLIIKKIGALAPTDQKTVADNLNNLFKEVFL